MSRLFSPRANGGYIDVAKAIEALTSGNDLPRRVRAAKAIFQYLSENPSAVTPVLPVIKNSKRLSSAGFAIRQ